MHKQVRIVLIYPPGPHPYLALDMAQTGKGACYQPKSLNFQSVISLSICGVIAHAMLTEVRATMIIHFSLAPGSPCARLNSFTVSVLKDKTVLIIPNRKDN